jgi:hypothetical protein
MAVISIFQIAMKYRYQMAVLYIFEMDINIPTFYIPRASKVHPSLDFLV